MIGQGFVLGESLMVVEDEGAAHNEAFWAERFPTVLQYLFPPAHDTAVFLEAFVVSARDGAVEITWTAGHLPAGHGFRLEARREDGAARALPFSHDGRGGYRALDATPGGAVTYSLHACRDEGSCDLLAERHIATGTLSSWRLLPLAPNPFRASVEIRLDSLRAESIRLTVHDPQGRLVALLHDGPVAAGRTLLRWDGLDREGRPAAAGAYFVRAETARTRELRKITLLR
jgi:hypothetical protein